MASKGNARNTAAEELEALKVRYLGLRGELITILHVTQRDSNSLDAIRRLAEDALAKY